MTGARAYFSDQGIAFPPVPPEWADRVERVGPRQWGFGGPDALLIDREAFLAAVEDDPQAEFLRFGRDGYSHTSQAVCFYCATGGAAVFVQARPDDERLPELWADAAARLAAGERVIWSFFEVGAGWRSID